MNWNLAEFYYEDYFFENRDYFVEATRLNGFFFRRNVQAGREIGVWILQALLFLYDSLNISEWFKL